MLTSQEKPCVDTSREASLRVKGNRIVAFGDSITRGYGLADGEGWVDVLACLTKAQRTSCVECINAGGNGNTSREGLRRLVAEVRPYLPATVLIEFGGNDPVNEPDRHVTPGEFRRNLDAMVSEIEQAGGECVILTFPMIISELHHTAGDPVFIAQGGIDQAVEPYREAARECAVQWKIALLDLDRLTRSWIRDRGSAAVIAADGIHWTPEANRLAAEAVFAFLTKGDMP